jgi:hypothetical protein
MADPEVPPDLAEIIAGLPDQLWQDAVAFRNACDVVLRRWSFVQYIGRAGGGGAIDDDLYGAYEMLAWSPRFYRGTMTLPDPRDLDAELTRWRRGQ